MCVFTVVHCITRKHLIKGETSEQGLKHRFSRFFQTKLNHKKNIKVKKHKTGERGNPYGKVTKK